MAMDPLTLIGNLLDEAKRAGADAADALCVQSTALSASVRLTQIEQIERAESAGVGVRVMVGKKQALLSSTDIREGQLKEMVARAVAMAKTLPDDPYIGLADQDLLAEEIEDLRLCDPIEPSAATLTALAKEAEEAAIAIEGITNSEGGEASYSRHVIALATSTGFAKCYETSSAGIGVCVVAGEGTTMERDYEGVSCRWLSDLPSPSWVGSQAAIRTLKRLNPRKVTTMSAPVVFDPRVSKGLVSAFASAINGAAVARGTSFLRDALGTQLFDSNVMIVDDPLRPRGLSSRPFDAEGVKSRVRSLVEGGVLKGWLLDVRSANQLKLKPLGNAMRGFSSPPSPSTSNLYMAPGVLSPNELLSDIEEGLYVTDVFGMGVNLITGDYSQGVAGFWIEKGEITYPVSEITIAGSLREMFKNLTPANDLVFRYGTNAPTVRIEGMTVAGA